MIAPDQRKRVQKFKAGAVTLRWNENQRNAKIGPAFGNLEEEHCSSGRALMSFLRSITRRQYFLYEYVLAILAGIGALAMEFVPVNRMQFLEGDMIISHTCGNTVKLHFLKVVPE